MKTPVKPVTEESLQKGIPELREFIETTEFAKKPEKKDSKVKKGTPRNEMD